ncbi:pentapeptide repeat-containing protein, partial [uncultured Oceanisphaera sp.]|uniref:pentapeptide repeat-containing protein n=1 Tax=uncultured Oceanisphaera sp. TaxID=353858 RepID=UPI00261137A5
SSLVQRRVVYPPGRASSSSYEGMAKDWNSKNLSGSNFSSGVWLPNSTTFHNVRFTGSNLTKLFVNSGILKFEASDFKSTDFSGADITSVFFYCSDLRGANFTGAIMFATHFDHKSDGVCSSIPPTDLTGAIFVGSEFKNTRFNGSARAADFSYSTHIQTGGSGIVSQADLSFSKFIGADYSNEGRGFRWQFVSLDFADMRSANFANNDFAATNGTVTMVGADLRETNLTNTIWTGVNLRNANLLGSNLTGADLLQVIWDNTTCPDGTNSNDNSNTCEFNL